MNNSFSMFASFFTDVSRFWDFVFSALPGIAPIVGVFALLMLWKHFIRPTLFQPKPTLRSAAFTPLHLTSASTLRYFPTSLGANAVVNVRFATSVLMGGAAELLADGTAVVVEDG